LLGAHTALISLRKKPLLRVLHPYLRRSVPGTPHHNASVFHFHFPLSLSLSTFHYPLFMHLSHCSTLPHLSTVLLTCHNRQGVCSVLAFISHSSAWVYFPYVSTSSTVSLVCVLLACFLFFLSFSSFFFTDLFFSSCVKSDTTTS
jgi:hypothetical protein